MSLISSDKGGGDFQQLPVGNHTGVCYAVTDIGTQLISFPGSEDTKKEQLIIFWEFPELKVIALEEYQFWDPDTVIVEAKASGLPLTHELRNMGIPVVNFTPSRGNDKVTRVHSVSPLFEAGMVWAPAPTFAEELIEEVAAFPNGEHDDLVDSMTQALMRYRQGNFVQLPTDDWQDGEESARIRAYY